jgi:Zn-dependent metalloprotease
MFHYHVADDPETGADEPARSAESFGAPPSGGLEGAPTLGFTSDEAAARYYLEELLQRDDRAELRSLAEPQRPERVPSLFVERAQDLRALRTRQVRFGQTYQGIPVFGANAIVELTPTRELVSVNAQLDEVSGVDPVESLSRADALQKVTEYTGATLGAESGQGGQLTYFKDDAGAWHLAWLLRGVPALPPAGADDRDPDPVSEELLGHGLGPRPGPISVDYLVDAQTGDILFHYSAVPTALPTPTRCKGIDENEQQQTFLGRLVAPTGTDCELDDPLRSVRTYDLQFADINSDPPVPANPVRATSADFGTTQRAGVSAHVNASRVQDFYKLILQRDGIDDQGMALISQVNVTDSSQEPPPSLLNAFWYQKKMWYGQIKRGGRLVSLSRYLDVIGHELTHGVVETTSALVYATQSGALNESFADIAAIIISNWYTSPDRADVSTWNWEIGPGLRPDGRPLRDLSDPARLGYPDHMNKFKALRPGEQPSSFNDWGYVHFNSSIPNKAAYNLLTIKKDGERVFTVEDVALLTYLGMARLPSLATFTQALQAIIDVAQTYFGGQADKKKKLDAISEAYQLVGIKLQTS